MANENLKRVVRKYLKGKPLADTGEIAEAGKLLALEKQIIDYLAPLPTKTALSAVARRFREALLSTGEIVSVDGVPSRFPAGREGHVRSYALGEIRLKTDGPPDGLSEALNAAIQAILHEGFMVRVEGPEYGTLRLPDKRHWLTVEPEKYVGKFLEESTSTAT